MRIQLKCGSDERRRMVKDPSSGLNAIDYLEVLPRTATVPRPLLLLHFFKPELVSELRIDNVLIEGGIRKKDIGIAWIEVAKKVIENLNDLGNTITADLKDDEKVAVSDIDEHDRDRVLIIRPITDGDFSMYTLRLIRDVDNQNLPPVAFDAILSLIDFTFKVQCPTHFDCKVEKECPPEIREEPVIDYMAKDYASFRRLMLDRVAALMPEWKERNVADLGVVLVELLAYVGDHLSYYQDAVSTETYLGTARKRVSVRRHARMLDYYMHNGSNARAWVYMKVSEDVAKTSHIQIPEKTQLLTGIPEPSPIVREENLEEALRGGAELFETMHPVTLYKHHNKILFYTWGEPRCCLPKGATCATLTSDSRFDLMVFKWNEVPGNDSQVLFLKSFLRDNFDLDWVEDSDLEKITETDGKVKIVITDWIHRLAIELIPIEPGKGRTIAILTIEDRMVHKFTVKQEGTELNVYTSTLQAGDYLLFEEVRSPSTHLRADADPSHRHVVRLSKVEPNVDVLNNSPVIEIAWDQKDALPFPLCLWEVPVPEDDGEDAFEPISVARGNIVLADHGKTVRECLQDRYECRRFRPLLSQKPLTQRGPFDLSSSASSAFAYEMQEVYPHIHIEEYEKEVDCKTVEEEEQENAITWHSARDLLSSDRFSREFVVEMENDGTALIRFGDGILGMEPEPNTKENPRTFCAIYRVGNGPRGNVGAESIERIVRTKNFLPSGIAMIRNPMPARGGRDSEGLDEVRQYAPQAFRRQERAVTESDYSEVLKRHPEVQRASAMLRWTGSWYTVFVAIDRFGGKEVDDNFKEEMRRHLERYRLAGYDVEINAPLYAPLYIQMKVCVDRNYFRDKVEQELLTVLSNRDLPDGRRGFFHPDNFTFGQSVYLSQIYETVMRIQGVCSVTITRFERLDKQSGDALEEGAMKMGIFEIARLDMDQNRPENGRIDFCMEGGQ